MANLKYFLWLTTRKGFSIQELNVLLNHFGTPETVYFASPEELELLPIPHAKRQALLDKSLDDSEQIMADCDRLGIRILTIQDAGYPERLAQIYDPPLVLYLKGRELKTDDAITVGVVGTRSCTPYGQSLAGRLGMDLARAGAVLVSGIAPGIDAAGIRGHLQGGGNPVCVLGNGIDVIYPRSHAELYADVAAVGTLVSEYPPGTRPEGYHFPIRNRIISGLSMGVVVAEAGEPSGALITARLALEQDREVFAFPGPVNAPASLGCHRLIQRAEAKLILSAQDVLEELKLQTAVPVRLQPLLSPEAVEERMEAVRVEERRRQPRPKKKSDEKEVDKTPQRAYISLSDAPEVLTDDEREILLAIQDKELIVDDIVDATQIPARRVLSALTMLQLDGRVEEKAGKRFAATVQLIP